MRNKISVCIATYNGEKYIKEQIDSILIQLSDNDEIIISDDNSTDNTLKILESLKDDRVKVYINDNNNGVGLTYNFENALKKATGDYIFLSDQDDVWMPNKVQLCVKYLESYDLVVTNCTLVDENLNQVNHSYFALNNSKQGFFKNLYRSSYLGSCLAFDRRILNIVLPFPSNLKLYHDWWIGFIADSEFKVYFIEQPLMLYRRHSNNMSTTGSTSNQKISKRIFDRLQLLFYGFRRIILKW